MCHRQVSSQMFFMFLSGFQFIFSNDFDEFAQKAARSPSRRGKYLDLIGTQPLLKILIMIVEYISAANMFTTRQIVAIAGLKSQMTLLPTILLSNIKTKVED